MKVAGFSLPAGVYDYTFTTLLGDYDVELRLRFNERDQSWYLDLREIDGTAILLGARLVTGARIGDGSGHPFFAASRLFVVPTTSAGGHPGRDELGNGYDLAWADYREDG